jgi:hypothetical protein
MPPIAPDPDAAFDDVQMTDLDEHLATFTWAKEPDAWIYSGPCPRCTHTAYKRFAISTIRMFEEGEQVDEQTRTMRCTCEHAHEGREPGAEGCGAWWGLALTFR